MGLTSVLEEKKYGNYRFCVYFRRLYLITVRDSYPLPLMDERIDRLGEAKYLSILYLNWEYWEIKLKKSEKDKTRFV